MIQERTNEIQIIEFFLMDYKERKPLDSNKKKIKNSTISISNIKNYYNNNIDLI